jgi:hypothetical protein
MSSVTEIKKQALNEAIEMLREALSEYNGIGRTHRRSLIAQAIGKIKAILEYYEEK